MKRFSKSILLTILVITMVFVFVGCKSTQATTEPEPVAPAPAEPAPAPAEPAPAPAEPAPAPAEPAPAAPAPAEPAPVAGIEKVYTIAGQEIKVTATVGIATISYPTSIITEDDLLTALSYVKEHYAAYLDGITYDYKPGLITLFYPGTFTADDFAAVESLTTAYVAKAVGGPTAIDEVTTTKVQIGGETTTKTVGEGEYTYEIAYAGYKATVTYKDGVAVINYPSFITNKEIMDAAAAAYLAYPQYLKDTTLVVDNGTAVLTLPKGVIATRADLDLAAKLVQQELPGYVASYIGQSAATATQAAIVAAEVQATAAAAEAQAAVTAAAEAAQQAATAATTAATTATTAAATTTTATTTTTAATAPATTAAAAAPATAAATTAKAAAETAKKSSTGLIIVIVVLVLAACAAVAIILKKKKK